ncbi:hypothetical protein PENSPDRAFT_539242, partial [Peniophora sp. CONT]
SPRQSRWKEFMERFQYSIQYEEGLGNVVADALSRYYVSDNWDEWHPIEEYVNADECLDPDGED